MSQECRDWFEKGEKGQLLSMRRRVNKRVKSYQTELLDCAKSYASAVSELEAIDMKLFALKEEEV